MPPSVIGYMPLCSIPCSQVCNEQGVGQWPMWKRFDSLKAIIDHYVDEPYRNFLAKPLRTVDQVSGNSFFYWYTPFCNTSFVRLCNAGSDHDQYKAIFDQTLAHYYQVINKLSDNCLAEQANFLRLSLKFIDQSEANIFCGDGRVVATIWGMSLRPVSNDAPLSSAASSLFSPEPELRTVTFLLGQHGSSQCPTVLKKSLGSKIFDHQVPVVIPDDGYVFSGWDNDPLTAVVSDNLVFTAQFHKSPAVASTSPNPNPSPNPSPSPNPNPSPSPNPNAPSQQCHVRFLSPDNVIIKEVEVELGKQLLPGDIPLLPAVNGVVCPAWDGNPLNDTVVSDRDYKALAPPSKSHHTVRFLSPDNSLISQSLIPHGDHLDPDSVPPLPLVNGQMCPAWNADPLQWVAVDDFDFIALPPTVGTPSHSVRFLAADGSELASFLVPHDSVLQPNQVPSLPDPHYHWSPNPYKLIISSDTDFFPRPRRRLFGSSFWRILFFASILLLLVFLVLYIMYLCNPCSK